MMRVKINKLSIINNHKMPFLQYIDLGIKKAECRVATEYIKSFKVGDRLILKGKDEYVLCEIIYLNFYDSFEKMISIEGFKNLIPFAKSEAETLKIYKSFPGANRVYSLGCCAIGVKCLESKLDFQI